MLTSAPLNKQTDLLSLDQDPGRSAERAESPRFLGSRERKPGPRQEPTSARPRQSGSEVSLELVEQLLLPRRDLWVLVEPREDPAEQTQPRPLAPAVRIAVALTHTGCLLCPTDQGEDHVADQQRQDHSPHAKHASTVLRIAVRDLRQSSSVLNHDAKEVGASMKRGEDRHAGCRFDGSLARCARRGTRAIRRHGDRDPAEDLGVGKAIKRDLVRSTGSRLVRRRLCATPLRSFMRSTRASRCCMTPTAPLRRI